MKLLNVSVKSALSLIGSNILIKIVSFLCGILIYKYITKESYTLSKIYFEFLFNLILFIPKETIKQFTSKYCLDSKTVENIDDSKLNLNYKLKEAIVLSSTINFLVVFVSIIITILFYYSNNIVRDYTNILLIYFLSALIELYSEPILSVFNINFEYKIKSVANIALNFSRIFITLFLSLLNYDLYAIVYGKVFSSIIYALYLIYKYNNHYNNYFNKSSKISLYCFIKPNINKLKILFENKYDCNLSMIFNLFYLNIINFIITHAQSIMLIYFINLPEEEKGNIYFIQDNLSLICRFFYAPIEESLFNYTASLIANKDFVKLLQNNKDNINVVKVVSLFKLVIYFSLNFFNLLSIYFLIFGVDAFNFVYSKRWLNSHLSIIYSKVYCIYIGLLSVAGSINSMSLACFTTINIKKIQTFEIFKVIIYFVIIYLLNSILIALKFVYDFTLYNPICIVLANILIVLLSIFYQFKLLNINKFIIIEMYYSCDICYIFIISCIAYIVKNLISNLILKLIIGFISFNTNLYVIYKVQRKNDKLNILINNLKT